MCTTFAFFVVFKHLCNFPASILNESFIKIIIRILFVIWIAVIIKVIIQWQNKAVLNANMFINGGMINFNLAVHGSKSLGTPGLL